MSRHRGLRAPYDVEASLLVVGFAKTDNQQPIKLSFAIIFLLTSNYLPATDVIYG